MAEPRDTSIPNEPSREEQAERPRGDANAGDAPGITNRPIEEDQRDQQNLPPRGDRKDGTRA